MKLSSLLSLLTLLGLAASAHGQRIIAQWNFNDANSIAASYGTGESTLLGGVTGQFFTGSAGDPGAASNLGLGLSGFPEQGTGRKTAGVQFTASTAGYEQILLSFDFRGSSTASRNLAIQYSTDGVTFLEAGAFSIARDGTFTNGLTVDLSHLPGASDQPAFAVRILSDFADATGYQAIKDGSSYSVAGTWRFDLVTLAGNPIGSGPLAPRIVGQPQSQSANVGATVNFAVVADGTAPLSYQWTHANTNLPGATASTLALTNVQADQQGSYQVLVSNSVDQRSSDVVTLTVQEKPGPIATNIAYLHTLLDPVNFLPTDTTNLYTIEGVTTTHVNLTTTSGSLFYIQDETAGIAVFVSGGAGKVPPAGAKVRVTGPLGHYNGLLEMNLAASNPQHGWLQLSTANPLPKPVPLEFAWQNDALVIEPYEGRYLVASNVWIDLTTPTFASGSNVTITNELGETMVLRVDARTDIAGQPKPKTPVTILGVLGQFDTADPRTGGYQLLPSRFADIVSTVKAPTVRFTNVLENLVRPGDLPTNAFTDLALRAGEQLTITFQASDPEGRVVQVQPATAGLPPTAQWTVAETTGTNLVGTFTFHPNPADLGTLYPVTLLAWNSVATNTTVWNVYVPTAVESQVILTEYLANPTANTNATFYNPLRRDPPTSNTSQHDEYLELANLAASDLDLQGWSIADAVQIRQRFYDSFTLGSSNAVIVFGGPLNGLPPNLDVPSIPASESTAGLALNNDGDTLTLRNADSNVVLRLVYSAQMVSTNGSMTRYPDANGPFVPQTLVSTNAVTPGRQYDGKPWNEPPTLPPAEINGLAITLDAANAVSLTWQAEPGRTYSVWKATTVTGTYSVAASGLSTGQYTDTSLANVHTRFYRISTP